MAARVLIIGDKGREHSLGWKLAQSKLVEKIYYAPGNGATEQIGDSTLIDANDGEALSEFARQHDIDLTVVGPEHPSVSGVVDEFERAGQAIFGPNAAAAKLESSKAYAAEFMAKYNIPRPNSTTVNSPAEAYAYVKSQKATDYVIKASGLAGGKGVVLPGSKEEAKSVIGEMMEQKIFGMSGEQVVFQERLSGQEVSAFAFSDGQNIIMLPFFQDHKTVYNDDQGPNTGGMGAYTPLPFMDSRLSQRIKNEIMMPTISGMAREGTPFRGVLYAGLFITENGDPKVIEYNCRFGDPECQPMMMMLDQDLYPYLLQCARGQLELDDIKVKNGAAAVIILASKGYPKQPVTGHKIYGLENINDSAVTVFHSGTKKTANDFLSSGGRVLSVTAYGTDLKQALSRAYTQIGPDAIHFQNMHYRTDIGAKAADS